MNQSNRRTFLVAGGAVLGTSAVAAGVLAWSRARHEAMGATGSEIETETEPPDATAFPNALRLPGPRGMLGWLDVSAPLTIVATSERHAIFEGKAAPLLVYRVTSQGDAGGEAWINPVFRVRSGATVVATLRNALDEPTIIHWHGLAVDAANDGHPSRAIAPGTSYEYRFQVPNRAGMYWYHPHPHELTAKQAYLGLAGAFIVEDDEELALQRALDLRLGETDIPLLIQDKRFDAEGGLVYAPTELERANGYLGDTVLVNSTPQPYFAAATRLYRFRILNGSNARVYRLAFTRGGAALEVPVIGTDGGLLDRPYPVKEAFLAPGERLDVLLDLRDAAVGDAVILRSLAFDPMHAEGSMAGMDMGAAAEGKHDGGDAASPHAGMAMGAPMAAALADGAPIDLLRIDVARKTAYEGRLPTALSELPPADAADLPVRTFRLDVKDGIWRINGEVFAMTTSPVTVTRGAREVWEIRNEEASMPHPMHLHGFSFRVLSRSGSPAQVKPGVVDEQHGLTATDLGWKDTVLVWPGETVRLAMDFSHPHAGDQVYTFHCHNLEHEDQGMMINVEVRA